MSYTLTDIYNRNEMIWGEEAQGLLFKKHVAVIGLGGVGGYTAEALARSGVGSITIVDFDNVSETDINRQLSALIPDIGKPKASLIKQRINLINPHINVTEINEFCSEALMQKITDKNIDFLADAIDTLKSKISIIETCRQKGIPVVSCLGTGNRIKPEELYITDISDIRIKKCPFAKNVIYQLKKRGIEKGLPVVMSRETPVRVSKKSSLTKIRQSNGEEIEINKFTPGSSPFVPPVAGYIMAGFIIRELINLSCHSIES